MTLRDYVDVVLRRKKIVIAAALLTTLLAVALSAVQTPIYASKSEILIQPRGQDGLFEERIAALNARAIDTEIQVIEGQAVRLRVMADLGLGAEPDEVNATAVGQTDVVSLNIRSANAQNAATLANAYARAYIDVRREQAVGELLAASSEVQSAIDDLQIQIDALPDDDARRAPLVTQLANFNITLDQLRVDSALRTGGATIIREAVTSTDPVEPTPVRTAILALVVGLLLGLAAAFLVDYLDDKVRDVDDIGNITPKPVLAEVAIDATADGQPLAMENPDSQSVESYRALRTNLQFLGLDRRINVVQLTSSLAGEGKTTTATNLAIVLARAGNRVALVDADLRKPRVHAVFGYPVSPGLTDLLLGAPPKDVVHHLEIGVSDRLSIFTSGYVPSNPSELLSGRQMKVLLDMMGKHYDYVVVDSAPVLPVTDSVALSGSVDGVVVVAQSGRVTMDNLTESLARLERVSAPVLGVVLNQTSGGAADGYYYGGYQTNPDAGNPDAVVPNRPPPTEGDSFDDTGGHPTDDLDLGVDLDLDADLERGIGDVAASRRGRGPSDDDGGDVAGEMSNSSV